MDSISSDLASVILAEMAASLRNEPAQFHVQVMATGVVATASDGGTGISSVATAGAAFAKATGFRVTASTGDVSAVIARSSHERFGVEREEWASELDALAEQVQLEHPDKGRVQRALTKLKGELVPAVVYGVAANVVSARLGISV